MTRLTVKTGTEEDFFKRGRQLAKVADRGEQQTSDTATEHHPAQRND
jgi:hypothetical protein